MTIILAGDAPWSGAALAPDHRPRIGKAQAIVPEGVVMGERPRSTQERRRDRKQTGVAVEPVDRLDDQESAFTAAIIAASLPPPPPSMDEAIQAIAEARTEEPASRLRDRLA